jgi:hypothetical protein
MYIVTSNPKRISSYDGVSHFITYPPRYFSLLVAVPCDLSLQLHPNFGAMLSPEQLPCQAFATVGFSTLVSVRTAISASYEQCTNSVDMPRGGPGATAGRD